MKETLTKENFWNELEQNYPKAFNHFMKWLTKYKKENEWNELFNDFPAGTSTDCDIEFIAPEYHELPIAMQFGIFTEFSFNFGAELGLQIAFVSNFDIGSAMIQNVYETFRVLENTLKLS